jgi:hypothetical protein
MIDDPPESNIVKIEREADEQGKAAFVQFRNKKKHISFVAQHTPGSDRWCVYRVPHSRKGYVRTISDFDGVGAKEKAVHAAYNAALATDNDRLGLLAYQEPHGKAAY